MRRNLLALAALIVVISASWILISVDWQEYIGPRSSTILRNQILFVGSSSNTTKCLEEFERCRKHGDQPDATRPDTIYTL